MPRAVCPAAATTQTGFPAAPPELSSGSRDLPAQECAAPGARWSPAHRSLPGRRSSRPRDPEDAPTRPKHRRPCQAGSLGATAVAPHDLDSWTKCIGKVTAPDRSTGGRPGAAGAAGAPAGQGRPLHEQRGQQGQPPTRRGRGTSARGGSRENKRARSLTNRKARHDTRSHRPGTLGRAALPKSPRAQGWLT